jgi:hypothetical protein
MLPAGVVLSDLYRLPPVDEPLVAFAQDHLAWPEDAETGDLLAAADPGDAVVAGGDDWTLQPFPNGLIYRSYLAGVREPRFASVWSNESKEWGAIWDVALGGRVGIVRYGTNNDRWPEGWQIDMEGAAFPRLDPTGPSTPLLSADFRFGIPITYGVGRLHVKTGYYHLSSHLGDEFLLANPGVVRSNYSRDVLLLGAGYYLTDDCRIYGETGWADWAPSRGGVSQPWEFQFGVDYTPAPVSRLGGPFGAVNAHLRQEANFDGNFVVQTGWQLPRGPSGQMFRIGVEYFRGLSHQASFYERRERKIGWGMWYDY